MYLKPSQKILIAGASGMVGSALVRLLTKEGFHALLTPSHTELDLTQQTQVRDYLMCKKPDLIIVAAARVGGIYANMTYPAQFLYENLMIAANLIHGAHEEGIDRLLFLGSTCIYPRETVQPISEESLLTGALEKTNEAYALAKITGVKLCQFYREQYGRRYIAAMPTNLYGPNDNYHEKNSHVLPALIRRFHEAKIKKDREVIVWGSGNPYREFLHVDDLARACFFLLQHYDQAMPINVGSLEEISIKELANLIAEIVGFEGSIRFDLTKPDGTPRKKSDISKITSLGWKPTIPLKEGILQTYKVYSSAGLSACG